MDPATDSNGDGHHKANTLHALRRAIEPWRDSKNEPPFTTEELIAMALIHHDSKLTYKEIVEWIYQTFGYYRDLILAGSFLKFSARKRHDSRDLRREILKVKDLFESPLRETSKKGVKALTASVADLELLLDQVLLATKLPAAKRFDFFRLPAEIRNTIYELVFAYPKSGLHVEYGQSKSLTTFGIETRSCERPFDFVKWESGQLKKPTLFSAHVSDILAPLGANRQFYAEAMSTFYRINHFHCVDVWDLNKFLSQMAPERRKHLSHISVEYGSIDQTKAASAFRLLATVEHLTSLHILVKEDEWLSIGRGRRTAIKKYSTVMNMPGISTLRRIRGLKEVTFHGPCPTLESNLKADMLKPKPKPTKKTAGTKKRKVAEDGGSSEDDTKSKKAKI